MLSNPDPLGDEVENAKTPWNHLFDVKLNRAFKVGKLPLNVYVYVQNILNRRNVKHVYPHTGTTTHDGWQTNNVLKFLTEGHGEGHIQLYDLINHGHRQHYQITRGGDLFGRPREIRFGLSVGVGLR